jgi:hypothetical protein
MLAPLAISGSPTRKRGKTGPVLLLDAPSEAVDLPTLGEAVVIGVVLA